MKSGCFGFYVQAPTNRYSTRSALNADNISRKSGFSITGALKRPRIESELPHHPDALGGGHHFEIFVFGALMKAADADRRWTVTAAANRASY